MKYRSVHYGWVICAGCTCLLFVCSGLLTTSFSVYMPFIIAENGFSNTSANLIGTIRTLSSFLFKLIAVWVIQRLNTRKAAILSCLLASLAFFCFSLAQGLTLFYIGAVVAGAANGLGTMTLASIILRRWFKRRLALTLSISASGSALAATFCPSAITLLVERYGLNTAFRAAGYIAIACAGLLLFILVNTPEEKDCAPYEGKNLIEDRAAQKWPVETVRGLSGKELTVLTIAPFLIGAIGLTFSSIYSLLCADRGFDAIQTSLAISVYGVSLFVGKILYGTLNDIWGGFRTNRFFLIVLIGGFGISCFMRGIPVLLMLSAALTGAGMVLCTVGIPAWVSDLAPPPQFDRTVGHYNAAYSLGGFLFSLFPGPIADFFGTYFPVFFLYVIMSLLILFVLLRAYHLIKISPSSSGT